jgi:hypothetical protein
MEEKHTLLQRLIDKTSKNEYLILNYQKDAKWNKKQS